jgi:hypothetical protein
MEAYMGIEIKLHTLTLALVGHITSRKIIAGTHWIGGGWSPELVWSRGEEKSHSACQKQNPGLPACGKSLFCLT